MPRSNSKKKVALGKQGEFLALSYLQNIGYKFVTRNWYCTWGELDLVMKLADMYVFVEVKTRSSKYYGSPTDLINYRKKLALSRSIFVYLEKFRRFHDASEHSLRWRLDVVTIVFQQGLPPQLNHYPKVRLVPLRSIY